MIIKLTSNDCVLVDTACGNIAKTAKEHKCEIVGPIPLKRDGDMYVRLIDIRNPTPRAFELIAAIKVPRSVNIEIKEYKSNTKNK